MVNFDIHRSWRLPSLYIEIYCVFRVCETAHEPWDSILDIKENNSRLNDAGNANQALSTEDIQKLKEEGKSGDEIIAALTQHSATFATKTQFSQV